MKIIKEESLETEIDIRPRIKSTVTNSLLWRIIHGSNYLFGGILFTIGSIFYYTKFNTNSMNGYLIGAWLYTIGSFAFLVADFLEWFHNRKGCLYDTHYEGEKTLYKTFSRASIGINFFFSVLGSLLYLTGSICFIPATNSLLAGEYQFIIGSLIIFCSQLWKVFRTAFTNDENSHFHFKFQNISADFSGFFVDLFAGMGGLIYAIGTYLFSIANDDDHFNSAANFFVIGGINFFVSGCFMIYRYFIQNNDHNDYQLINYPDQNE